jgi:hypothetical protein
MVTLLSMLEYLAITSHTMQHRESSMEKQSSFSSIDSVKVY